MKRTKDIGRGVEHQRQQNGVGCGHLKRGDGWRWGDGGGGGNQPVEGRETSSGREGGRECDGVKGGSVMERQGKDLHLAFASIFLHILCTWASTGEREPPTAARISLSLRSS